MKTLLEVANDLNAVKEERSHARVVVPSAAQSEDNMRLVESLLEGTGITQAEVAGLSLEVGASALNAVATVDGGMDGGELMAVFGSIWVDGLLLGVRYMRELDFWSDLTIHDLAATPEDERQKVLSQVRQEAGNDEANKLVRKVSTLKGGGATGATRPPKATEPTPGADPARTALTEDPRGERDQ